MQAAVPEAGAGVAVAAAPHAELQLVPPREVDRHGHVLRGRRAHDHRGPRHARAVVDSPQLVIPADVDDDDEMMTRVIMTWARSRGPRPR